MNKQHNIYIRMAQKKDVPEIHNVLSQSFVEFKEQYTTGAYDITVVSSQEIIERMEEGAVWVAELDKKIVGTVGGFLQNKEFYIVGMVVLPQQQGKKIGYKLLQQIENYACEKDYSVLSLRTSVYLDKALSLYKSFGFSIVNEPPYDMSGTPCINMKKQVSKSAIHKDVSSEENSYKNFLIIETYKPNKRDEVYQRFSKKGRMLPAGVEYINSWVTEDLQMCYQIMTAKSKEKLMAWIANWEDLVDFKIVPVISSEEAKRKMIHENDN